MRRRLVSLKTQTLLLCKALTMAVNLSTFSPLINDSKTSRYLSKIGKDGEQGNVFAVRVMSRHSTSGWGRSALSAPDNVGAASISM
jgi:hypothetical protein